MKSATKLMMTSVLIASFALASCMDRTGESDIGGGGHLKLLCTPELENLAIHQVTAFQKAYPEIPVQVVTIPGDQMGGQLNSNCFALVDQRCRLFEGELPACRMVIGRDAIVPFMNAGNPNKGLVLEKGITPQQFRSIYSGQPAVTWGILAGSDDERLVKAYQPAGLCGRKNLSGFLGLEPGTLKGTTSDDPSILLEKVQSEKDAIGFCSLAALMKHHNRDRESGICLVPIDNDGNGRIDHFEDIYRCCDDLTHGIFVGRYPRPLYNTIYLVAARPPTDEEGMAFAGWMVSGGQNNLASLGYLGIEYAEKARGMEQLAALEQENTAQVVPLMAPVTKFILIILGGVLLISVVAFLISYRKGKAEGDLPGSELSHKGVFARDRLTHPQGLFYDRSHTWTFMEKDGRVRIGVDDFIQHVTGPLTRVIMRSPGETIHKGELLVKLVQQGKQVEIKSPVTGKVEECNTALEKDAALLNREPYSAGWVYMVQPVNWLEELKGFLLGDSYKEWLKTEFSRLKDFFATCCSGEKGFSLALQEGGEIRNAALEQLGPYEWEEFQVKFLDRS